MQSSWMLCRAALVGTDVSEECITSIMKVTKIGELGNTSQHASVASYRLRCSQFADYCHLNDGDETFLRNASSYNSQTA
jgi:hypothetical protein